MSAKSVAVWDNWSAPGGATNTLRGLTHSLDLSKEGLAMQATRTCSIEGCDRQAKSRGWCHAHYTRWLRYGSTGSAEVGSRPYETPDFDSDAYREQAWKRMLDRRSIDANGCWVWTGFVQVNGYGRVAWKGDARFTHRVSYEINVGPVPDGLVIDHLCRNRTCFNPEHLEAVTHRINLLRGDTQTARRAAVTHCPQGHEYTPENTRRSKRNQRACKTCLRERRRARYKETA